MNGQLDKPNFGTKRYGTIPEILRDPISGISTNNYLHNPKKTKHLDHGLLNIRLDLLPRRPKKKKASLYLAFIDKLYFLFIQILYLLWYLVGMGNRQGPFLRFVGLWYCGFRRH